MDPITHSSPPRRDPRHRGWLGCLALCWLLCWPAGDAHGATPPAASQQACETLESPRGKRFEVGLVYQSLIPSGLPDLNTTLPLYGLVLGVPVLGGTLQASGAVGSEPRSGLFLLLGETSYRLEISFPYMNTFAIFGAHWLRYEAENGQAHEGLGVHTGLGLSFLMGENFEMAFSLKTYIQSRTTIVFGGGFSFLI